MCAANWRASHLMDLRLFFGSCQGDLAGGKYDSEEHHLRVEHAPAVDEAGEDLGLVAAELRVPRLQLL